MKFFYMILTFLVLSSQIFSQKYVLVIHGGAGTITKASMTDESEKAYREKLTESLKAGSEILASGGTSLDAIEKAVNILEDSPLFNAGKGAVFNAKGENELDASIMDGRNLKAGAVAGIKHIKNPISLARLVMENSPHVMMIGEGAEEFAKQNDLEFVENEYFKDEKRWNDFQKIKRKDDSLKNMHGRIELKSGEKFGTVGAVALDKNGNLAAATSTGGMMNKKFGRVGDSPIIGAGTYANNKTCAISATGYGEYFIRLNVAHDISAMMEYKNLSIKESAEKVINEKLKNLGGYGGVIAVDKNGKIAMPFNTEGMFRGYILDNGEIKVEIYKD